METSTIEELLSLVDPSQLNPTLPVGHPFHQCEARYFYWSSTLGMSSPPTYAWGYNFGNADTSNCLKSAKLYVWLVRGGFWARLSVLISGVDNTGVWV